ncbi:MAG: hypothetical protein WC548_03875 [Candidatus Pacearchaeota archaeon]
MVMNKRGQELTLGTVILIVLGIVVLVFLIFGFSTGWSNLWDKITNWGGGKVNLDTVRQGCELACTMGSVDDFCTLEREVRFSIELTSGEHKGKKVANGTCDYFEKNKVNYSGLNIEHCAGITCSAA